MATNQKGDTVGLWLATLDQTSTSPLQQVNPGLVLAQLTYHPCSTAVNVKLSMDKGIRTVADASGWVRGHVPPTDYINFVF